MKLVKLEDVCYSGSSNISQKDVMILDGSYPIYGASGFIKNINFYKSEKPYIAIVKDGSGVGRTMILPEKSSVIGTMQYIFPRDNIDIRYLYYAITSMDLSKYCTGIAIPHIYFKDYKKEKLNLPSISEQVNIANKLDLVQKIIDLKQQQIKNLDELIKSQFVEMFENGDNDCFSNLEDVCEEIISGGDRPKETSDIKTEKYHYPVFANAAFNNGLLCYSSKYKIDKPCVTVAARGCTVGFTAIRNEKFTPVVRLIALIPNDKIINTYLKYYIDIKMNIEGNGAAQPQLTIPMIRNKKIFVPPIELQNKFSEFVKLIDKQKFILGKSLKETEELKKSLMNKYFG